MDFFWQRQKKLLSSPTFRRRYHPHLICFSLSVHAKSPAAYRELASSGVLVLPSERVLRDYWNFFIAKPGFNKENIQKLSNETTQLFDCQRYVVLSFDEMKVQSNLVFDKHTNELIGFVELVWRWYFFQPEVLFLLLGKTTLWMSYIALSTSSCLPSTFTFSWLPHIPSRPPKIACSIQEQASIPC